MCVVLLYLVKLIPWFIINKYPREFPSRSLHLHWVSQTFYFVKNSIEHYFWMFCYAQASVIFVWCQRNKISVAPGRIVIIEFCPHVWPDAPPGPWSLQLNYETRVTWHVRPHKRHVCGHVTRGDCWDCGGQHPGSFRVISLHPINFCNSTIDNKPAPHCSDCDCEWSYHHGPWTRRGSHGTLWEAGD